MSWAVLALTALCTLLASASSSAAAGDVVPGPRALRRAIAWTGSARGVGLADLELAELLRDLYRR